MNYARLAILSLGVVLILACSVATGLSTTPAPLPTLTPYPTYTPYPTQVFEPTLAPTEIVAPSAAPTTSMLATVGPFALPQEWTGYYNQTGVGKVKISLLIEERNGNSFKGKMLWHATQWYRLTITRMNGEFMQDFGDAFEQERWSNHPDVQSGDRGGTWLKWTETEMISGNSLFTMNGWYYAHIRANGTMVGIYYFNATEKKPATDLFELKRND